MKWVLSKAYKQHRMYQWQVDHMPFYQYHRRIPTLNGRFVDLFLVTHIHDAADALSFLNVPLTENNLSASVGLCCRLLRSEPGVVHYHPSIDSVVLLSTTDTGFTRGLQAQRRTAAHEAAHAAVGIACAFFTLDPKKLAVTLPVEEVIAHWTGVLADTFIEAVMAHHRGVT